METRPLIKIVPAREAKDCADKARKKHMQAQHKLVYSRIMERADQGFNVAIFDATELCFILDIIRPELVSLGYKCSEHALVSSAPVYNNLAGRRFVVEWG